MHPVNPVQKKHTAGWLLLLLITLPWVSSAGEGFARGLLWEVRVDGRAPSYLLGTIHSEDPRVTRLPEAVAQAFADAERLVLEIDLNAEALQTLGTAMLSRDGSSLKSRLGEALFQRTAQAMAEYGIPDIVLDRMKPWAVAVTLMMPKTQTGLFLDRLLYEQAIAEGKTVAGLETAAEQMAVFDSLSMAEQIEMLTDAVAHQDESRELLEAMTRAYLARDLVEIQRLSDDALGRSSPQLVERLNRTLVVERNHRMVERMQPQLEAGHAFIAIGALHLPGREGILNLLAQRGYALRALY